MIGNLTIMGNGVKVLFGLSGDAQSSRSAAQTGSGGWQLVDRPRSQVATEWTDLGQWQLTMSLIMDGYTGPGHPTSIEQQIATVEAWEDAEPGSSPALPPRVTITAGPVPHKEVEWVVYTLTWGNAIRAATDGGPYYKVGDRLQQELQIVLWQFLPPTLSTATIALSPAKTARDKVAAAAGGAAAGFGNGGTGSNYGGSPPPSSGPGQSQHGKPAMATYTVKTGDTLQTIAARQLGSYTYWTQIAALNNIRDPRNIKVGQVLVMPYIPGVNGKPGEPRQSSPPQRTNVGTAKPPASGNQPSGPGQSQHGK